MEYMWGGIGSDEWVSELVLMSTIWRYFLQMAFFNSQRILLIDYYEVFISKENLSGEKFFEKLTWD